MGNAVSNQTQTAITDMVQKSLNESITNVKNENKNSTKINQEIEITFNKVTFDCNLNIEQDARTDASVIANFSSDIADKMSNELTAKVNKALEQDTKQSLGPLAIGNAISNQSATSKTFTKNELNTIIKKSISNSIVSDSKQNQKLKLSMEDSECKNGRTFNFGQTAVIKSISNGITSQIVSTLSENKGSSSEELTVKQVASQAIAGIGGFLFFIFMLVGGIMAYCKMSGSCALTTQTKLIIGGFVLLIIIVILVLSVLKYKTQIKKDG